MADGKHAFNDRLFCDKCGADAIGLRGWPNGMVCPFKKPPLGGALVSVKQ